jgi:hypothetical protein
VLSHSFAIVVVVAIEDMFDSFKDGHGLAERFSVGQERDPTPGSLGGFVLERMII